MDLLAVFTCMNKGECCCCCSPCRFSRPLHTCICIYIFVTHFLAFHQVLHLKNAQTEFEFFTFLFILKRICSLTLSLPLGRHLRSLSFDAVWCHTVFCCYSHWCHLVSLLVDAVWCHSHWRHLLSLSFGIVWCQSFDVTVIDAIWGHRHLMPFDVTQSFDVTVMNAIWFHSHLVPFDAIVLLLMGCCLRSCLNSSFS